MRRRKFLSHAGKSGLAAVGAVGVAAPAVAQPLPEIRWRLASSFPKTLDTVYGAAEIVSKLCSELTDGKLQIRAFAAGEVVPGLQVADAVQNGTVEMGHTASYYYVGKDPTFAFDAAVPFGLNARQQTTWMEAGGGREVMNEFFKDYNIYSIPCGNTGAQMGGWFRKEIKTLGDLQGLKMRIGGFAGQVFAKLGVVPQQIAGGEIYPALEKGTIDAAEWIGPYDDQKLGFNKVAPFYYYPGWWEGSTQISLYVNNEKWQSLPKFYKSVIETASRAAHTEMTAKYDLQNPKALRQLIAAGTQLKPFSESILNACFRIATDVMAETCEHNPKFKKVFDSWKPFRSEEVLWFRVSEYTFDNFMARQSATGKL